MNQFRETRVRSLSPFSKPSRLLRVFGGHVPGGERIMFAWLLVLFGNQCRRRRRRWAHQQLLAE